MGGAGVQVAPAQARGWGQRTWTSNEDPPLCPRVPLRPGGLRSTQDRVREGPDASELGSSGTVPGLRCLVHGCGSWSWTCSRDPHSAQVEEGALNPRSWPVPAAMPGLHPQTLPSTPVRVAKPSSELLILTPLSLGLSLIALLWDFRAHFLLWLPQAQDRNPGGSGSGMRG